MFVFSEDKSSCLLPPKEQQRGALWAGDTCSTWTFPLSMAPLQILVLLCDSPSPGSCCELFSLVENMKIQLTKTPFEWDCRKPATS